MTYSKESERTRKHKIDTFFFTSQFKDERVRNLLMAMISTAYGTDQLMVHQRDKMREYGNHFKDCDLSQISWFMLCDVANKTSYKQCTFFLLFALLGFEGWDDPYKPFLMEMEPIFRKVVENYVNNRGKSHNIAVQNLFCYDDIRKKICFIGPHDYFGYLSVETKNTYLKQQLQNFFNKKQAQTILNIRTIEEKHKVISTLFDRFVPDFNQNSDIPESIFWKQVKYLLEANTENAAWLSYLFKFYVFLMEGPMPHLFISAEIVSLPFLKGESTIRHLRNGYHFVNLDMSSYDVIRNKRKVVFILKGYDRKYNTVQPYDFKAFNCSGIEEERYVPIFWEYALKETLNDNIHFNNYDYMIVDALNVITRMKEQPGYECTDPFIITRAECIAIKASVFNRFTSKTKRYQTIAQTKCFLSYCEETGLLGFEKMALRRMQNEWQPNDGNINETISADTLSSIMSILKKESETDIRATHVLAMIRLLLDTEFRISMICSLKTTDLMAGARSDEWYVKSITKTSHGKTIEHVITKETAQILLECIEATKEIRCRMDDRLLADFIFIYYSKEEHQYRKMKQTGFSYNLNRILSQHGINQRFCASDFRNTHMTKALQYCIENGKNDLEKALLTKHKKLMTTLDHYYDTQAAFCEQLEDTYDIEISPDLSVPGNVVANAPAAVEVTVEHGCGVCTSDRCIMHSNLPCLLCRSFITTPLHEPFFKEAVNAISETMRHTEDEHAREDLRTRKSLLVLYLEKIYEYKEKNKND